MDKQFTLYERLSPLTYMCARSASLLFIIRYLKPEIWEFKLLILSKRIGATSLFWHDWQYLSITEIWFFFMWFWSIWVAFWAWSSGKYLHSKEYEYLKVINNKTNSSFIVTAYYRIFISLPLSCKFLYRLLRIKRYSWA